jgi:hypothetical protein
METILGEDKLRVGNGILLSHIFSYCDNLERVMQNLKSLTKSKITLEWRLLWYLLRKSCARTWIAMVVFSVKPIFPVLIPVWNRFIVFASFIIRLLTRVGMVCPVLVLIRVMMTLVQIPVIVRIYS